MFRWETRLSNPCLLAGHPGKVLESRGQKLEAARSAAASWWVSHGTRVARREFCGFYQSI